MPYPRQIYLGEEVEDKLASYIEEELLNYYAESGDHINDLLRWQKDYWAKPTKEKATFPFYGAATIVIPLSAISVEAVHARTDTKLFGQAQLVTAQSINDQWDAAQKQVEDFMNREITEVMRIKKPAGDCLLEAEKFGTMIGKTGYERKVRRSVRSIGDVEQEFEVVYKQGACFDCVPDARFLMPYYATDAQTSPWVGEEHSETPYGVMQMEMSGLFREGTIVAGNGIKEEDTVLGKWIHENTSNTGQEHGVEFEAAQQTLENTKPSFPKRIDWVELWLAWDVEGKGKVYKEIVVHYHRLTRKFLSIRYNWLSDLRRPYRSGVYFPVEHRWRGIGICKMNEQFQREVTVQHRQRLDNATLANMRMLKISKLSGYGSGEPIFPGKMWFVDDVDHIDTLQMGEIYPSSYNNEQATLLFSQQRTGVNELSLGMPQTGTPGTATSDLARIQEGNMKYDSYYGRARDFIEDVIIDTADLIQQYGPRHLAYYTTASGGNLVKDFFKLPASYIRDGLIIKLRASSQMHNKVLDRQNWQQVAAFIQQYYQGLVQLALPLNNPEMLSTIFMKGMGAATEALRQILETYDVRNIERIIIKELENIGGANGLNGAPQQGGSNGVSGAKSEIGMDSITQALSLARGNGGQSVGVV